MLPSCSPSSAVEFVSGFHSRDTTQTLILGSLSLCWFGSRRRGLVAHYSRYPRWCCRPRLRRSRVHPVHRAACQHARCGCWLGPGTGLESQARRNSRMAVHEPSRLDPYREWCGIGPLRDRMLRGRRKHWMSSGELTHSDDDPYIVFKLWAFGRHWILDQRRRLTTWRATGCCMLCVDGRQCDQLVDCAKKRRLCSPCGSGY